MRIASILCLSACSCVGSAWAQAPRNMGVTFNGETEAAEPLATGEWHTVVASYRYPGGIDLLTNTYLVIARGGDQRSGFYIGYNLPRNELAIVKHGFWNETEATGAPGEVGKIIENDQGYMDCEHTTVTRTADDITISYRIRFKPDVLQGTCNVFQYVEDKDVRYDGFTIVGSVTIGSDLGVHRTDMPAGWRNSLRPEGKPSEPLLLAEGGKARYALVIPADAQRIDRKAAADLAADLQLICDAEFEIRSEAEVGGRLGPYISIGRTALLAASACKWMTADLAAEGYGIEVIGGNVYVYGGTGRGLMNAVYSLLEEDLGCRWYSTTSVDTPRMERFEVRLVPRKHVPVLELRDPCILKMHDPTWSLRNRTNTPHARIPMSWGGSIRYHLMGHTYATYFPREQYFAEHPEYYALVNGKRQTSQLCHTNEDVIRLSVEKTCQIFRDHPDVTVTAIGPNDGRGFCDCPNCKKLDDENGGRSGSFWYFVNRIAEGVKREFPNNHLISLAYLDYARPPTQFRVDDYIIIQLCTDSHAWKYQFCFVDESEEFQAIEKAWQAAGANVFVWDYTTDYVHYLVPMANWPVVADNTRFHVRHGVRGIMYESECNDIDEMRAWVWAKQLWDPDRDTKALMEDFVFGYYKEAGQPIWDYQMRMWDYWERWHEIPHQCGVASGHPLLNNLQCSYAPDGPMFTPEFMRAMRRDFTEAERLAQSDEIRARVRRAKLPLLYLELCQGLGYYTEFGDFVDGTALHQPKAAKEPFQRLLDEFAASCKEAELTTLGIPASVDKMSAKWQACIEADSPPLERVYLPAEWAFAADAEDRGVTEKWYSEPRHYEAAAGFTVATDPDHYSPQRLPKGIARVHINRGVGWEQQGFPGLDGYGWYFRTIDVPAGLAAKPHLYLYFRGVNEEARVYVNGELAFERTLAAAGKSPGDLAGAPFGFDAKQWLEPGGDNQIAVRVMHSTGLGGICAPAMLAGADEDRTTEQLDAYRQ